MSIILITAAYGIILVGSWELQKHDLLLGYTLGLFGILATTVLLIDYLSRRVK